MGSKRNRPKGITAISTLLVTLGALVCGASLLALCVDLGTLTGMAGLRFELTMLGFFFAGGLLAGFGIGLYEGYAWARPAALAALAFVATLQVFSLVEVGPQNAIRYEAGVFVLAASSVLYLSMGTAKRFFSPFRQPITVNVEATSAVAAVAVQRAS